MMHLSRSFYSWWIREPGYQLRYVHYEDSDDTLELYIGNALDYPWKLSVRNGPRSWVFVQWRSAWNWSGMLRTVGATQRKIGWTIFGLDWMIVIQRWHSEWKSTVRTRYRLCVLFLIAGCLCRDWDVWWSWTHESQGSWLHAPLVVPQRPTGHNYRLLYRLHGHQC